MVTVRYTGHAPISQPALGLLWQPDEAKPLPDGPAAALLADPASPFVRVDGGPQEIAASGATVDETPPPLMPDVPAESDPAQNGAT